MPGMVEDQTKPSPIDEAALQQSLTAPGHKPKNILCAACPATLLGGELAHKCWIECKGLVCQGCLRAGSFQREHSPDNHNVDQSVELLYSATTALLLLQAFHQATMTYMSNASAPPALPSPAAPSTRWQHRCSTVVPSRLKKAPALLYMCNKTQKRCDKVVVCVCFSLAAAAATHPSTPPSRPGMRASLAGVLGGTVRQKLNQLKSKWPANDQICRCWLISATGAI